MSRNGARLRMDGAPTVRSEPDTIPGKAGKTEANDEAAIRQRREKKRTVESMERSWLQSTELSRERSHWPARQKGRADFSYPRKGGSLFFFRLRVPLVKSKKEKEKKGKRDRGGSYGCSRGSSSTRAFETFRLSLFSTATTTTTKKVMCWLCGLVGGFPPPRSKKEKPNRHSIVVARWASSSVVGCSI